MLAIRFRGSCTTSALQTLYIRLLFYCNSIVNCTLQRHCTTVHVRISIQIGMPPLSPHLNAKLLSTFNFMRYTTLNLSDSFVVRSLRQTILLSLTSSTPHRSLVHSLCTLFSLLLSSWCPVCPILFGCLWVCAMRAMGLRSSRTSSIRWNGWFCNRTESVVGILNQLNCITQHRPSYWW